MLKHSWIPSTSSSFSVQSTDWSSTYVLYSVVCFDNIMTSHCKWCYNLWAIIANKQPKKMPVFIIILSLVHDHSFVSWNNCIPKSSEMNKRKHTHTISHTFRMKRHWKTIPTKYFKQRSHNQIFFSALLSKILVEVSMSLGPKNQCSVLLNI